MSKDFSSIKALTFDVFGTVVDWRSSIIREGRKLGKTRGIRVNWVKFADAWRGAYAPSMDRVRKGELPWMNIDTLHRMALDQLLNDFHITSLTEEEKDHLNRAWHRLKPWPDSVRGLRRLKKRFILAPLSNGNIALMTNLAKHSKLPWDCILSAELARHYKPDKEAYLTAAELLGLKPNQIMMVAAHQYDLRAANALGFRTGFVKRPLEFGRKKIPDLTPDPLFDLVAENFDDLADQLDA